MAFDVTHKTTMDVVHYKLRGLTGGDVLLTADHTKYKSWYALLLGSFAMTAGNEEVVFAHLAHDAETDTAAIVVYTSTLVTVVDVRNASAEDASVVSRTVARRTLQTMGVSVSERHDGDSFERSARMWPGTLTFELTYAAIPEPIIFSGLSYDPYRSGGTADALVLLDGLRRDLVLDETKPALSSN